MNLLEPIARNQVAMDNSNTARSAGAPFPPEFLRMIVDTADNTLSNWLQHFAPEIIAQLHQDIIWLKHIQAEGTHDPEGIKATVECVTETINLLTELGAEWQRPEPAGNRHPDPNTA